TQAHRFVVTAHFTSLGGPHVPAVGTEDGNLAGSGAVVARARITRRPTSSTYTLKGTVTDIYSKGTITSRFTATVRVNANKSLSVSGRGTYTGGGGSFRNASGKYTFTGSRAAPAACTGLPLTVRFTGTISY